jgi:hypothetical protein
MSAYLEELMRQVRTQYFDEVGAYSSDEEILKWYKERADSLEEKCKVKEAPAFLKKAKDIQVGGDHYKLPIQPIDFITKNKLGFIEGNIIKYIVRHDKKNGIEDLNKAMHYLQMLMEEYK